MSLGHILSVIVDSHDLVNYAWFSLLKSPEEDDYVQFCQIVKSNETANVKCFRCSIDSIKKLCL